MKLGHTPHEELGLDRYDDRGRLVATGFVMNPPFRSWLVPVGTQIAILSDGLDAVARFDLATMSRLDPPDVVFALRDRLERWGGPSVFFRSGLAVSLAIAPLLPIFLGVWLVARRPPNAAVVTWLTRVVALLAVVAVTSLVATVVRYFYL